MAAAAGHGWRGSTQQQETGEMAMRELEYISDEGGRRYPTDQPYTQRDQGHRAADELVYVVISDVADVLRAEADRLVKLADRADELVKEAAALWYPEGTTAVCAQCGEPILLDQREGGGTGMDWGSRPENWVGNGGSGMDYGCDDSPLSDDDGTGGHSPEPRTIQTPDDSGPDGWLPNPERDADKLQDILRDAESLDDVYVEWCADAGTVLVTLSRYWEDYEEEGEGE